MMEPIIKLSDEAKGKLLLDKREFINVLGTLRGENIYEAAFTIAVHSKVFDMIYNDKVRHNRLSELIINHESPVVNIISGNYVLQKHTDFNNLKSFVEKQIQTMIDNM